GSEFGEVLCPAQQAAGLLVRLLRQPMLGDEVFGDRTHVVARAGFRDLTASRNESRISRPSSLPRRASAQRSGCGIMPKTLPASLTIPPMLSSEPLGLASGVTWPSFLQ